MPGGLPGGGCWSFDLTDILRFWYVFMTAVCMVKWENDRGTGERKRKKSAFFPRPLPHHFLFGPWFNFCAVVPFTLQTTKETNHRKKTASYAGLQCSGNNIPFFDNVNHWKDPRRRNNFTLGHTQIVWLFLPTMLCIMTIIILVAENDEWLWFWSVLQLIRTALDRSMPSFPPWSLYFILRKSVQFVIFSCKNSNAQHFR